MKTIKFQELLTQKNLEIISNTSNLKLSKNYKSNVLDISKQFNIHPVGDNSITSKKEKNLNVNCNLRNLKLDKSEDYYRFVLNKDINKTIGIPNDFDNFYENTSDSIIYNDKIRKTAKTINSHDNVAITAGYQNQKKLMIKIIFIIIKQKIRIKM
ncbi:hypothetical protein EDEG_00069 [Edhazardia aedis USNM 41457]|uniref:Uncharacterized protein n=1 Tax=Edhazardia aedis (strain USNM 41457) TaxID=1003232 RepID=J9DUH5_EDHAE|nr:hypothetical protein EDEG_00069 [Edhazardia aedis USNM 41457]|eukprot:EJW04952.1 hypothetical protein EDEG_00069 [Edhazardia aedis USNM 41457]